MTFARPINDPNPRVTQGFGPNHRGTDYGYVDGTPVYASQAGTVIIATNHYTNSWTGVPPLTTRDYGNLIRIDHGGGFSTLYAHLKKDSLRVSNGQQVRQGQLIAGVGSTGNSTGNHLHWEIRKGEVVQDPSPLLDWSFTAYGESPVGGDGPMVQVDAKKFEELVTKSSAYDALKPEYDALKAQFDENNRTKDDAIRNLNQQVNDRNNDITKLNAEVSSLKGQLEAMSQQVTSYGEIAKRVPALETELNDTKESRQGYIDENVMLAKTIEEDRKAHAAEITKLTDNAPYALVQWVMRIVRGGEK